MTVPVFIVESGNRSVIVEDNFPDCLRMDRVPHVLQRTELKDLQPSLRDILVVGIIIAKQRPRKFADTKNKDVESYTSVLNFTLRDSPRHYINVTYWDKPDTVNAVNDKFYTGDVVEIRRPRVEVRKFDDSGEQYRPMVTSPYSLMLIEQSEILMYRGDTLAYSNLLRLPTKPLLRYMPIRDIHNEGATMKGTSVDILGAVATVGEIRNIRTRHGEEMQLREVILFDLTSSGLKVTIWDVDVMTRANSWRPRTTILFITDVRVEWSNFNRNYSVGLTPRSIVTENPIGKEADILAAHAKEAMLDASALLDQLTTSLPPAESIQNTLGVQQVQNRMNAILREQLTRDQQFTALIYGVITKLDLDGQTATTSTRCAVCKNRLKLGWTECQQPHCASACGTAPVDLQTSFDIRINVTDHTGTLVDCRLMGATAEAVLDCSVQRFSIMSDVQKTQLKWKFLMERCAVRIMVLLMNQRRPLISIVSCERAQTMEVIQKIPVY